jgi:hypothetical protein
MLRSADALQAAVLAAFVVTAVPLGSACNALTGADALRLGDDDDASSDGNPSEAVAEGAGASSAGGDDAVAVGAGNGSSATGPSSATSGGFGGPSGSSGVGGDSGSGSSSGGPEPLPTDCGAYPSGPYGVAVGSAVPPSLSWQGYAPGSDQVSTVVPDDFYDCDGTRGIDAVLLDTSQFG